MATEVPTPETGGDVVVTSELPERAPLHKLPARHWAFAAKRALKEFTGDGCTDLAAALTYFSVLSIFPAMLALVSILGLVGEPEETKQTVLEVLGQLGQGEGGRVTEAISGPLDQMVNSPAAGLGLVIGLAGALWSASGYVGAFGRALKEFTGDGCTDLAAALTYFSVLSIFPAMLALVSILGLVGEPDQTKKTVLDVIEQLSQGNGGKAVDTISGPLDQMVNAPAAGLGLVIGLAGALWSASGYVGAFGRALNKVYGVEEGRGFIKLRPAQLGITAILLILAAITILALAVSGGLAEAIGSTIGLGETAVRVWNLAKLPVVLLIVIFMIGLLYYATPNVSRPFRWLSPGAFVALVVAIVASVGFFFYVSNFGSYGGTYGSLAGVIIFLLWLWILNNVLLLGAEFDAELERSRQLRVGEAVEGGLVLEVRDTTKSDAAAEKHEAVLEEARSLRIKGLHDHGKSAADLADEDIRRD